jgi:putative ABC transport system permease protein
VNGFQVAQGRMFTDAEERGGRRVAVVGALAGDSLGVPTAQLLGQTVHIRGISFEVIGVLAEKGGASFANPDEAFYVPLQTAQLRLTGQDKIRSIAVQAQSEQSMPIAMAEIDRVLRREHRLRPGQDADFNIRNEASLLTTVQETAQTFSFLLAGIAAISLLVGGIGIMNIMLVSVTERTREIGIRLAIGAMENEVLTQFLVEAVMLSLFGGIAGIALGLAAAAGGAAALGLPFVFDFGIVAIAFLFSGAVGVIFGYFPARKAAQLDPIEALRHE